MMTGVGETMNVNVATRSVTNDVSKAKQSSKASNNSFEEQLKKTSHPSSATQGGLAKDHAGNRAYNGLATNNSHDSHLKNDLDRKKQDANATDDDNDTQSQSDTMSILHGLLNTFVPTHETQEPAQTGNMDSNANEIPDLKNAKSKGQTIELNLLHSEEQAQNSDRKESIIGNKNVISDITSIATKQKGNLAANGQFDGVDNIVQKENAATKDHLQKTKSENIQPTILEGEDASNLSIHANDSIKMKFAGQKANSDKTSRQNGSTDTDKNNIKTALPRNGVAAAQTDGNKQSIDENSIGAGDKKISNEKMRGDKRSLNAQSSPADYNTNRIDNIADKQTQIRNMATGDRLFMAEAKQSNSSTRVISDIEIKQNKQIGDIHVLKIKLNPDELGSVEARLRKTNDGLHIELHAERQETARLLASDHQMLGKAIEKSGFHDDGQLTIIVVDKTIQTTQQGQSSAFSQNAGQNNSGQGFSEQRQFFGQQNQGGQNEAQRTFSEVSGVDLPDLEEPVGEKRLSRDPRRLVV